MAPVAGRNPGRLVRDLVIAAAVALGLAFGLRRRILGIAVGAIGAAAFLCGWLAPGLHGRLMRGLGHFGRAVGLAFTWGLLVPFFYLCFTCGRLVLLIARKDPLQRRYLPRGASYWVERPASPRTPEAYKRPY